MKIEIEAKIRVESLEPVAELLKAQGATLESVQHHLDSYFVDAERTLTRTDRGLRLRRQTIDGNATVILTYKGAREKTKFKSRQEVEVQVEDHAAMADILEAIGFTKRLEFEKKRQLWDLADCEICLDQLPLIGSFIEVEGPSENAIENVLDMLGLSGSDHISCGYSRLMRDAVVEHGLDKREIMFPDTL